MAAFDGVRELREASPDEDGEKQREDLRSVGAHEPAQEHRGAQGDPRQHSCPGPYRAEPATDSEHRTYLEAIFGAGRGKLDPTGVARRSPSFCTRSTSIPGEASVPAAQPPTTGRIPRMANPFCSGVAPKCAVMDTAVVFRFTTE
jgi:hypothetical protein